MQVLIADDDLVGRAILEHALRQWRYDVITVRDGAAAWDLLQQDPAPPIAILDWMMPTMDGPELCRRVRTLNRTIPPYLILLTAKSLKRDIVRGLENGADDYIAKPFDVGELRSRLKVGERIIAMQERLFARVRELEDALARGQQLEGDGIEMSPPIGPGSALSDRCVQPQSTEPCTSPSNWSVDSASLETVLPGDTAN